MLTTDLLREKSYQNTILKPRMSDTRPIYRHIARGLVIKQKVHSFLK